MYGEGNHKADSSWKDLISLDDEGDIGPTAKQVDRVEFPLGAGRSMHLLLTHKVLGIRTVLFSKVYDVSCVRKG